MSFQSAQPSSQRSGRSSEDAFETLVDASAQGSHATVAQSRNSRDQFNIRPNVPRQDRVTPEPTGDSRISSAPPPQTNPAGADRNIRKSAPDAEASSVAHGHGIKHDDPELASIGNASDSKQTFSDTTVPDASLNPVATPPAVAVPVTAPVAGAPAELATQTVRSAAEPPPAHQTGAIATSPANAGIRPALATDTEAIAAVVLQETPGTEQAVRTVMQTEGALAAAVATATPDAAKATVKTLDNAPSGRTTASVTTGIQPGPEAPVLTTPPAAAGGNPVSSHDASPADHKHDAAGSSKNAPSDVGTFSTEPASVAPHPARAPDAASAPQPGPADSGQSINSALAQPQVQSAATTPATPQYNVAVATGAAVPLNGLAVQIAITALSGKSRFEIRLDPADLGRIDVRLDVDRQGRVTSHLTIEKPETLAMLRQDAPQLQRALQDAGLKTGDGGLQFSLRDQSSQEQNARDDTSRHNQRLIVTEENIPVAAAGRDYGRILGSNRGLDIRV
jgi:flagellar hook-length control protein FliK